MGQAKARGTKEQRVAEAKERRRQEAIKNAEAARRYRNSRSALASFALVAALSPLAKR